MTICSLDPDYLARDHVTGQPRVVLQDQPQPAAATFRVPLTAPGRYLVLVYDGTEDGMHYSWDYIRVRSAPRSPLSTQATARTTAAAPCAGDLDGPALAALAVVISLLGTGVFVSVRKHRTRGRKRIRRDGAGQR